MLLRANTYYIINAQLIEVCENSKIYRELNDRDGSGRFWIKYKKFRDSRKYSGFPKMSGDPERVEILDKVLKLPKEFI